MKRIALTQGQFALVDDEDFEHLSQWKWFAQKTPMGSFYAQRREHHGGPVVLMHRYLAQTPAGLVTDHVDGNGLNNQRANLRSATALQNMMNKAPNRGGSSPLKGAVFDRGHKSRPWRASIRLNGRLKYLGNYTTPEEAAAAYAAAATVHFGAFARTTERAST